MKIVFCFTFHFATIFFRWILKRYAVAYRHQAICLPWFVRKYFTNTVTKLKVDVENHLLNHWIGRTCHNFSWEQRVHRKYFISKVNVNVNILRIFSICDLAEWVDFVPTTDILSIRYAIIFLHSSAKYKSKSTSVRRVGVPLCLIIYLILVQIK